MSFAQKLCYFMDSSKVSAYKMSKDTGISDRLIGYWRKGEKMPGAENLIIIANYFNTSIDYLLDRTEEPTSKVISNIKGDNIGNNTVGYNINQSNDNDKTTNELVAIFKGLSFGDKAKVMSLIAELSEKKGA